MKRDILTFAVFGAIVDDGLGIIGASLEGAVADAVSEVGVLAETARVVGVAAQFAGLVEHVLDTELLQDRGC